MSQNQEKQEKSLSEVMDDLEAKDNANKSKEESIRNELSEESNAGPDSDIESDSKVQKEAGATKAKKSTRKKKFILASAAALLATGGVATFIILNNQPKNSSEDPIENAKTSELEKIENPFEKLRLADNSLSDFDLEFLKLENNEQNKIYSPLSIKYALAMLKDGANGDSKTQIENLIGEYKPKAYLNSENRSLANALFVRDTFADSIVSAYPENLKSKYNAELILDSFATPDTVNNWVSDKTFHLVKGITDDVSGAEFILVNALAIDMQWNNQLQHSIGGNGKQYGNNANGHVTYIHENYNHNVRMLSDGHFEKMNFNNGNETDAAHIGASANRYDIINVIGEDKIRETVRAELEKWISENPDQYEYSKDEYQDRNAYIDKYMEGLASNLNRLDSSTDFYFSDTETEKVFAKDLKEYDGSTLQYISIMPKVENLDKYSEKVDANYIQKLIANLKNVDSLNDFKEGVITKIDGYIPFFDFDYELALKNDLKSLGVVDVFDNEGEADLSNITDKPAFIMDAKHKANIEFTNDGIRAAAITAFMGGLGGTGGGFRYSWDVPVEEIDLTFDKPYLFLIRDKATGEVWFAGTVYDPTK